MRASELAFSSKPKPDEGEPGAAGACFLPLPQVGTRAWTLLWVGGNSPTPDSGFSLHFPAWEKKRGPPGPSSSDLCSGSRWQDTTDVGSSQRSPWGIQSFQVTDGIFKASAAPATQGWKPL